MNLQRLDDDALDAARQRNSQIRMDLNAAQGLDRRTQAIVRRTLSDLMRAAEELEMEASRRRRHAAERERIEHAARASA